MCLRGSSRAFLAGRADELEYFVPAGVRIGALAQRYELRGGGFARAGRRGGGSRADGAGDGPRARCVGRGRSIALRYRVAMVRRDRWYVAAINTPKEG